MEWEDPLKTAVDGNIRVILQMDWTSASRLQIGRPYSGDERLDMERYKWGVASNVLEIKSACLMVASLQWIISMKHGL